MIAFIKGTVAAYGTDWIIIDNNGIGWKISYPHPEAVALHHEIMVYTYLHLREDEIALFGFESQEELDLFLRLIRVKGLGPKTAMGMLAKTHWQAIIQAIETGNVAFLKAMPGIGNKTASQIILDLKGKLVQNKTEAALSSEIQDAAEALKNLGYRQGEIALAAKRMNEEPGLSTEQYLKLGLQFLSKKKIGG